MDPLQRVAHKRLGKNIHMYNITTELLHDVKKYPQV